jgi:para-nitrobenzyl esterase
MANDIAIRDARSSPVVEIASRKLRGANAVGVCALKGVPYGASSAGRNRFMAPQPPQPWVGVRDAFAYAGHALQSPSRPKRRAKSQLGAVLHCE